MTHYNRSYWMWAEACELIDRADRLHRQFFQPAASPLAHCWEPPVDMFETRNALWLIIALPGVSPDQIELSMTEAGLIVTGVRRLPPEVHGTAIRRLEIPAGRFQRLIELPPGPFELAERRFADGCLTLGLNKLVPSRTQTWSRP
jgi:HSP20 family protein